MMIRVRSFVDQDECRDAVARICGRFAADALSLIDKSTAQEFDPNSEAAEAYREFREWLGPELSMLAQSVVVGPVLGGMSMDESGYVYIQSDFSSDGKHTDEIMTKAGRLAWLCSEIPSLVDAYHQLYEDEEVQALKDCEEADALNLAEEADIKRCDELMPKLEQWYMYAQPGFRIYRGDEEAEKALSDMIARAKDKLRAELQKRVDDYRAADRGESSGEKSLEAIERLTKKLTELDREISSKAREVSDLTRERNTVLDELEFAEEAYDAS